MVGNELAEQLYDPPPQCILFPSAIGKSGIVRDIDETAIRYKHPRFPQDRQSADPAVKNQNGSFGAGREFGGEAHSGRVIHSSLSFVAGASVAGFRARPSGAPEPRGFFGVKTSIDVMTPRNRFGSADAEPARVSTARRLLTMIAVRASGRR